MKTNLLKSIFISLILLVGATNAWALDFTSGTVVYFDNTETQWSKIYLRVGKSNYNSAYQVSTKVSGTQNLYKYTIPSWGGYDAFSFANSQGWTNSNSIYQPWNDNGTIKPNGSYAITGQTEYFKWNLDKMRLFIPASKSNKEHNCQYYNTNVEYDNYQRTVTITSPTNGSITVTYKDESDASQSKNSGNFKVAQTCIITVSATPNTGYQLNKLYIGDKEITSGSTYIVRSDVTISAEFVTANPQVVYLKPTSNWNADNPKFVVHAWNNSSSKDITMEAIGCASKPDYYTCTIPAGYHAMLFYRKNTAGTTTWNQTNDLTIPVNSDNICYTISSTGNGTTTKANGSWGTYTAPSYSITLNPTVGGLIEITPTGGSATTTNTSVIVNTKVNITLLPNPGYAKGTAKIKIGNNTEETLVEGQEYEICGNTTITAEFIPTNPTPVYLKVADHNWKNDNAWFAIYWWNASGYGWSKMTAVDCNGDYYYGEVAASAAHFVFVRLFPEGHTNYKPGTNGDGMDWPNKWAQTVDLLLPEESSNLYTVGSKSDEKYTGSWTAYSDPTYNVIVNIIGEGTITINDTEYSTNTTISNIALNGDLHVSSIVPADRWAYHNTSTITIGNNEPIALTENSTHAICGPTTIKIPFDQTSCKITFDLHLPNGVDNELMAVNPQYVEPGGKAVQPSLRDVNDYIFGGWYKDKNCTQEYNFDTSVTQDIVIHAKWVHYSQCIFFKNNPHWDNVYVYTFTSDAWENNKGVHAKGRYNEYGKMTQIGKTDIFYYILTKNDYFKHIAFSNIDMSSYDEFHQANAIYRGDRQDQMQLFIPQSDQTPTTTNNTQYYSSGLWIKYNNTYSGYDWSGKTAESDWSDTKLTTANPGGYSFTAEVILNAGTDYQFKIKNVNGSWYGYNGTMTSEDCTNLLFETDKDNAKIHPTVSGTYAFTVHLGEGKVLVSLEYPLVEGDYRLAYSDDSTGFHPGHYIKQNTKAEEKSDTVSFFVHHKKDPKIWVQQCTEIDDQGNETWETIATYSATSVTSDSDHPNNAMLPGRKNTGANITIGTTGCNITETGVFNFVLKQTNENSTHKVSLDTEATHKYNGNFYIRTDATAGGWKAFRAESNQMNYSTYADAHENFSHYFCEWITEGRNVKFTIANDYSYCISDTLDNDAIIESNDHSIGCLPADANVRFGWDYKTNLITRAYLRGSTYKEHPFLLLQGNENLTDANGDKLEAGTNGSDRYGLKENEEIFGDLNNWVYQTDVTANQNTLIKLVAEYNGTKQYFKGSEEEYTNLLTSTSNQSFKIRLMYDFKTNHLVIAWLPESEITTDFELSSDMMIIRRNQENAMQVHFNPNSKQVSGIGTGYAVMTFDKYFLNNRNPENESLLPENEKKSNYERALYWVSFPFDVRLKEVFGFGEYGQHWIMEYYDGAARAANGLWADSDTYWKYITNPDYTLKAGQGYVLCLNLGKMEYEDDIFDHDVKEVSLYFPSASPLQTITGEVTTAKVPAHTCTIERDFRYIYDSNWNLIGVPGFKDITGVGVGGSAHEDIEDPNVTAECVNFYYKYIPATNKYEATDNTKENDFQTMFSYMVQYAGTIEWSTPEFVKGIAARRVGNMPSEHTLRLELLQSEALADQTIIKLQEQDATADFDMNIDMAKIKNNGANIYTMTANTNIMVAGNALPMQEQTVPVGVIAATTGEYTFRMPDGTDGISVILVDNQTGAHTNMLYDEYTVTLDAGTYENRFAIIVNPHRTSTSVDNIGDEANGDKATGVKKFIIDGQLFIRTTNGLFDAKGQRL